MKLKSLFLILIVAVLLSTASPSREPGGTLAVYTLFIRLPSVNSSVLQEVRLRPDLGLMLLIVLSLTIGWGSLRSLWAMHRWRSD